MTGTELRLLAPFGLFSGKSVPSGELGDIRLAGVEALRGMFVTHTSSTFHQ